MSQTFDFRKVENETLNVILLEGGFANINFIEILLKQDWVFKVKLQFRLEFLTLSVLGYQINDKYMGVGGVLRARIGLISARGD